MSAPFVRLGRVVKTHGLEGEIVVAVAETLTTAEVSGLDVWVVPPLEGGTSAFRVVADRVGPKGMHLHLEGLRAPEIARETVGRWLLVRDGDIPEPPAVEDTVSGYSVIDEDRGVLGVVADTIITGANDVLVVRGGSFGEVLIPVIDDVIRYVDDDVRTISVRLLPGLIDEATP